MAEMTAAMKTAKEIEKQLVQSENRLAYIQDEIKRLNETKERLNDEIAQKTSDFNLYMAQRDAETKRQKDEVLQDIVEFSKQKEEFQSLLKGFQLERNSFEQAKHTFDLDRTKIEEQSNNIKQFIIAVQRAFSLLGQ